MAATQYQVLYRLINDTLGTPITNNSNTIYNSTFEFYTDPDHRIFSADPNIQTSEMEKQQNIITKANSASNPKHDMLFVFNGTKKIAHQRWSDNKIGYVVRDWKSIRSRVGNKDDWTTEFFTLEAPTPEDGGIVVAPESTFLKTYKPYSVPDGYYTSEEVNQMFTDSTIYQLSEPSWKKHITETEKVEVSYSSSRGGVDFSVATGPIFVDTPKNETQIYPGYAPNRYRVSISPFGVKNDSVYFDRCYKSIFHTDSDVKTITIPGHYEDTSEAPYAIKDQYKRIESSPWIVNCVVGSFEAALAKARTLIDMIGIENVKVIKQVPFDQFIKIS